MSVWTLLARMPDRSIGGVLSSWALSLTLRLNEVGAWSLDVPPETTPQGWPAPGAGLVMLRGGTVVASGELDELGFDWSASSDGDAAQPGKFALTGDTDLGRLAYRIVYPTPSAEWHAQADGYWRYPTTATATAEDVLRATVERQAGPLALTSRRVPGLQLSALSGVGKQARIYERFTPLLDALRKVAGTGGGLAFDVTDTLDRGLAFSVRAPADRRATARFGVELGNVLSLAVRRGSPTATTALVAGQGQKAARELAEYPDPQADVAYGRREVFVDQRQVDSSQPVEDRFAEYAKAADEVLTTGGEQTAVSATIADTELVRWGRDYNLGDRVSVSTPFGLVTDLVRAVEVRVDETGVEEVSSVIGSAEAVTDNRLAATVRTLQRRLSQLERAQ